MSSIRHNSINRKTILIVWVIQEFRQINHQYIRFLSIKLLQIVAIFIAIHSRSFEFVDNFFVFVARNIKSSFVNVFVFSINWVVNKLVFRKICDRFFEITKKYRQSQIYQNFVSKLVVSSSFDDNSSSNNTSTSNRFHVRLSRVFNFSSIVNLFVISSTTIKSIVISFVSKNIFNLNVTINNIVNILFNDNTRNIFIIFDWQKTSFTKQQ